MSERFDLARAETWSGLRLGQTRAEAEQALAARGLDHSTYGSGQMLVSAPAWELEVCFVGDRLWQLAAEEDSFVWNGRKLIGLGLNEALAKIGSASPAYWTRNDAVSEPHAGTVAPGETTSDEALLSGGTLWLPDQALGLVFCEGEVLGLVTRGRGDLPAADAGLLTAAQRELAERPALAEHLRDQLTAEHRATQQRDPVRRLRLLFTLAAVATAGWLGWGGFQEKVRWSAATQAMARVTAFEEIGMKQFRDYVVPALRWFVPGQRPARTAAYRVEFTDPQGRKLEALIARNELYVPPDKVGDEVPIAWLDGQPPEIKGLARAQDATFIERIPSFITLTAIYLAACVLAGLVPMLLARLRKPAGTTPPDPHRPELS